MAERFSSISSSYLIPAKEDKNIADILVGVVHRQFLYICIDPMQNAFNQNPMEIAGRRMRQR